jgi:hypothetical protein
VKKAEDMASSKREEKSKEESASSTEYKKSKIPRLP